jgi:glyceraldehyde-3-phosphate dehydrogenase/erythrose-4-phosphate dehydrogenase
MISKDVARTLSELKLWQEDLNCGNNKLFNVLKAFANYDNEVGYV